MCTSPRARAPAAPPSSSRNTRYRPCSTRVLAVSGPPTRSSPRTTPASHRGRGHQPAPAKSTSAPAAEVTACCPTTAQAPAPPSAARQPTAVPAPWPSNARQASRRYRRSRVSRPWIAPAAPTRGSGAARARAIAGSRGSPNIQPSGQPAAACTRAARPPVATEAQKAVAAVASSSAARCTSASANSAVTPTHSSTCTATAAVPMPSAAGPTSRATRKAEAKENTAAPAASAADQATAPEASSGRTGMPRARPDTLSTSAPRDPAARAHPPAAPAPPPPRRPAPQVPAATSPGSGSAPAVRTAPR